MVSLNHPICHVPEAGSFLLSPQSQERGCSHQSGAWIPPGLGRRSLNISSVQKGPGLRFGPVAYPRPCARSHITEGSGPPPLMCPMTLITNTFVPKSLIILLG